MGAPNVYDTSYVNSGPGVGLSAGSNAGSFSKGSGAYSGYTNNSDANKWIANKLAAAVANQANMGTSTYAQAVRDHFTNPMTSAKAAKDYDDYMSGFGSSFDMDEYYDKMLEMTDYNNDWSAAQAQKQMDFQTKSNKIAMDFSAAQAQKQMDFQKQANQLAMNWSAEEAMKSRQWTERLSNTAHRREVKDLMAAGLNPILSANGGAWSGSGATGQAFSSSGASGTGYNSSGAMGQTDFSASGALGGLMNGIMTTARDMAVTKLGLQMQKYNTDMNYAMAKMQTEASIFNNNSSISAQKAINALNRDADISKSMISADATRAAASMSAGAVMSAASTNAAAARYSADQNRAASDYRADQSRAASQYSSSLNYNEKMYEHTHNIFKDPSTAGYNMGQFIGMNPLVQAGIKKAGTMVDEIANQLIGINGAYHNAKDSTQDYAGDFMRGISQSYWDKRFGR